MKRTRTSSSKLKLARESVRRLVDGDLVRIAAGGGVEPQSLTQACLTQDCPPNKGPGI